MGRIVLAATIGILAAVPAALLARRPAPTERQPDCACRLVSLAPHATESLFALGAGADVVGVDDYSREPPEARALPRLGSYIDPDLEGIVALRPDLVVLAPAQQALAEQLGRLGLPTQIVPDTRMDDVFVTMERLGGATCRADAARALVARVRREIADAGRTAVGTSPVRAVLVVDRPAGDLRQFYVAGPDNFLSDVLRAAGADNVFADVPHPFPQVSLEPIVAADPDLILELVPGADASVAAARVAVWRQVAPGLRAVRTGAIYALRESWLPVPGPAVGRAVRIVAERVDAARRAREQVR